jgi:hypothetical protein
MYDSDYKPARWMLEVVVVSLTPTNFHPNSSASLTSLRLVYRLGMNRAEIPLSHAADMAAKTPYPRRLTSEYDVCRRAILPSAGLCDRDEAS